MSLYAITTCFMEPQIIGASFGKFLRTAIPDGCLSPTKISQWVFVDHHWPIRNENFSDCIHRFARMMDANVICPERNLGGHGGATFALDYLRNTVGLQDDDLILGYDPDSNPMTVGWLPAMVDAMKADPTLAYLSLMITVIIHNRPWQIETLGGHRVAFHPVTDMFNITMWRVKALKQGFMAHGKFYGNVESAMESHIKSLGMRHGYLLDFLEEPNPIPHPKPYTDWKLAHAGGAFPGNFDEWLRTRG